MATNPPPNPPPGTITPANTASAGQQLATGVSGSTSGQSGKQRQSRSNSLRVRGGRREVKGYAVTKAELWTLGGLQAGSAICFSLAGSCFGFWASTKQQLDFAKDTDPGLIGYWQGIGDVAFYGMIGLVVLGLALFTISGLNVVNIIRGTRHD